MANKKVAYEFFLNCNHFVERGLSWFLSEVNPAVNNFSLLPKLFIFKRMAHA